VRRTTRESKPSSRLQAVYEGTTTATIRQVSTTNLRKEVSPAVAKAAAPQAGGNLKKATTSNLSLGKSVPLSNDSVS